MAVRKRTTPGRGPREALKTAGSNFKSRSSDGTSLPRIGHIDLIVPLPGKHTLGQRVKVVFTRRGIKAEGFFIPAEFIHERP